MQTEARVGMGMEGGQRAFHADHIGASGSSGGVSVDRGARKFAHIKQQSMQQRQQSQIGTVSQLLAGGVAGALSKTCTAPLARLTILFQVQGMHSDVAILKKASIWHEASRIVREEGVRAFWKGNLVTIAHRLPYSSVNFYAYEHYKRLLHMIPGLESRRDNMSTDLFVHFVGGGLAGITSASATYPLDLVRTRLAAQTKVMYYEGIGHALQTICKEEGFRGLYKGLGATLLGVGPSIAISFSVYETLRTSWQSRLMILLSWSVWLVEVFQGLHPLQENKRWVTTNPLCCDPVFFAFVIIEGRDRKAGGLVVVHLSFNRATFPLDLVRRRKQLEGAGGRARVYTTSLLGTFRHILRTEGLHGLYRGILPEYYKVVPGVGICFMTYETLKSVLAGTSARL